LKSALVGRCLLSIRQIHTKQMREAQPDPPLSPSPLLLGTYTSSLLHQYNTSHDMTSH